MSPKLFYAMMVQEIESFIDRLSDIAPHTPLMLSDSAMRLQRQTDVGGQQYSEYVDIRQMGSNISSIAENSGIDRPTLP